MRRQQGFTLIEIVIVVIMIGMLAVMSVIRFSKEKEKSRGEEAARVLLKGYSVYHYLLDKKRQFSADNPLTWTRLDIEDPNLNKSRNFDYSILNGDSVTVSIHANRIGQPTRSLYIDLSSGCITKTEPY